MSIFTSDMSGGPLQPMKCDACGNVVHKWIDNMPLGNLCVHCAQRTMRMLLQDLISFHNQGKHVDMSEILYHGDTRKEPGGKLYRGDRT